MDKQAIIYALLMALALFIFGIAGTRVATYGYVSTTHTVQQVVSGNDSINMMGSYNILTIKSK